MRNDQEFLSSWESTFRAAERAWEQGQWEESLPLYRNLLLERLASQPSHAPPAEKFDAFDLVLIERLADLAVLFGKSQAADNLLEAMELLCRKAGNRYVADYASLKRARLPSADSRDVRRDGFQIDPTASASGRCSAGLLPR